MQQQPLETKGDIVVEDDVWVGRGATILSRVHIGKGAVIGAGAVVTGDVPANTIVAGNPARVVRHRDQQETNVISDHCPRAVIVRRLDGTIKYWNRDACSMYGWEPEEAMAKQTHALLNTRFPQPLAAIEGVLALNGHWEGILVHVRRDGVPMIVSSRWALCEPEKNEVHVLETNRPIYPQGIH
jgi:PAS domain S-box-containing protein